MRYPKFLQDKGRIGFIAPSFGCALEPYHTLFGEAMRKWKEAGYKTVLGPNCYENSGVGKSNEPEACALEVNDFFINDRSDIIISCGGGETMCEDLPFIDFEAIAHAEPKWFMGYSDNTNLTFTLPTLADTAAIYGPCVKSFGMRELHESLTDAFEILKGERQSVHNYDRWEYRAPFTPQSDEENEALQQEGTLPANEEDALEEDIFAGYELTRDFKLRSFIGSREVTDTEEEIRFSGRLIGGCLDCLVNLAGTPFDKVKSFAQKYEQDGIVWFLEACDLNVMGIRRALWQLEQNGWFKNVKGFLIGRPRLYDDAWDDFDRTAAVMGILGKYKVPVILDLDIGHNPPMMPIISGAVGNVRVLGNSFNMVYEFTT